MLKRHACPQSGMDTAWPDGDHAAAADTRQAGGRFSVENRVVGAYKGQIFPAARAHEKNVIMNLF